MQKSKLQFKIKNLLKVVSQNLKDFEEEKSAAKPNFLLKGEK